MVTDGGIGDHAKKTEKKDGKSSFLICFGCRTAKVRTEMKKQQEQQQTYQTTYQMYETAKLWKTADNI